MKNGRIFILTLMILLLLSSVSLGVNPGTNNVYVIPIKGEINSASYSFLKDVINDIDLDSAKGIIFEIDTYGGLIDQASNIKDLIISLDVPTISFVNNKAESAGVLITIASENVVMATNSTIGSAETIPNTEKILSTWRAFLRDTAQYRGRDTEIIQAMADKDIIVSGINSQGKLINLTSNEALEHGITDLISDDYHEMLAHFGIANANLVKVEESLQVKLSKLISKPYISSLLLTLGLVGLVVEILTPGFGIGGTISIISFGLFFGGNILAGNSNWTSLALFATGMLLLVVEGIVPGFGLPGIAGIIFVLAGTVLAMGSLASAIASLSIAIIITTVVTIILLKLGFRSKLLDRVILKAEHNKEKGYLSVDSSDVYLDKVGISITELRPSGFIEIDGKKLDALSDSSFIPKDVQVQVFRVEGSKIFVRRI